MGRTGLKTNENSSFVETNPLQSLLLNIIQDMWDHLDRAQHRRRHNVQRRALECLSKSLEIYF